MKKAACFILGLLLLAACNTEKKNTVHAAEKQEKSTFEMYEMSEMATLMERMYEHHETRKAQLEKGETPDAFPGYLMEIHTAAFTDPADNDEAFKNWADLYIEYEKKVYTDAGNARTHHNNAVNVCVMCHQQKCTGPIPRIKKLFIAE